MPRDFSRTQRIADSLKKELATLIQFELRDPRISMISVTDVEVSRDLSYARIFYTSLSAETAASATVLPSACSVASARALAVG